MTRAPLPGHTQHGFSIIVFVEEVGLTYFYTFHVAGFLLVMRRSLPFVFYEVPDMI